jgi:hypothetical protein
MSSPLQQTTDVDVDAVPELTVEESQAPAGAAGSPLPAVGTNAKSEWAMWDPNLWWTDWALPPDPRPSWEQWFEWVNQLQALTPALGEASQDWQTMIGQFDESLRAVRSMRADLATWTGPSAATMSDALDRLEDSITTKSTAIQNNPARLDQLAQTISEAVPPMAALDAEYQQVLQDLNACRQVAERGKPIMVNLATELLRAGTDLENSVRTDNLAPQPVPPQPLALSEGPQGPTNQLQQVAGSAGLADPGAVAPGAQLGVTDQPTTAGASGVADPGAVQSAQQGATANIPGVAVGGGAAAAGPALPADPSTAAASPTLAGVSGGSAAPTLPPVTAGAPAAPTMASSGPMMPMAQFSPTPVAPAAGMAAPSAGHVAPVAPVPMVAPPARKREEEKPAPSVVRVPVPLAADGVTGSAAVPAGLRGRTGDQPQQPVVGTEAVRRDGTKPRQRAEGEAHDGDAFTVENAGTGTVTAPR